MWWLLQCPIYEYFKPDAYDYSKSKEVRQKLADEKVTPHRPRSTTVRPSAWGSHGRSHGHAPPPPVTCARSRHACGTGP